MQRLTILIGGIIFTLPLLVGCGSPGSGTPIQSDTPSPTFHQQELVDAVATETSIANIPIPVASVTSSPKREEIAPPYAEIRRNVGIINHRAPTTVPGHTDIYYPPELTGYIFHLQHMRVVDWLGWIDATQSPIEDDLDRGTYNYSVYAEIPTATPRPSRSYTLSEIVLNHVPEEQMKKLGEWQSSRSGERWHRVKLGGWIASVGPGANVTIYGGSIEPAE
jgi:hypothetical protein